MKLNLLGLSLVLVGALAAACTTGDQNSTNSGGNSDVGGGANTGAGNAGGNNTGGANSGGSSTGGSSAGGSSAGGSSTGGSSTGGSGGSGGGTMGGPCGGFVGDTCNPAQYCNYDDDTCGGADGSGTCENKPDTCPDIYDPVCACDGQSYSNACEAAAAGVDLSLLGGCTPPPGTFACGSSFCDGSTEYCQVDVSDVGGVPNTYACQPLPGNCTVNGATCACLADLPCGNMCEQADGGLTLTCPGG